MSRLIDADNAKIYLSKSAGEQLDRVPTADVQEVKHGKWVKDKFGHIICSECEQYPIENEDGYPITELKEYKPFYCPNCGAKMDGEEDNNE